MNVFVKISNLFSREQWSLLAVAAAGLMFRVMYLLEFSGQVHFSFAIGADIAEYNARARELLAGKLFPDFPDIHAPLYSLFLAGLYKISDYSVVFVRWVQMLMNFAAYIAVVPLLKRLGAPFRIQFAYLLLAMLIPVIFFHQAELISESLLAPLIIGTMWLLYIGQRKKSCLFGAGCMTGAILLTHGLMIFFAGAELIYMLSRKKWRDTGMFAAGVLLLILPVIAAHSMHYGKFTGIQANAGYNLWIGHNSDATGGCYLRPGRMWRVPLEQGRGEAVERGVSEDRIFLEKVGRFYLDEPLRALLLIPKKMLLLFDPGEPVAGADSEALIRCTVIQQLGAGGFAVVLLLALSGIFFAIRKKEKTYIHFYILVVAVAAGLLLTVVSGRYRQGMMPGLILLAALGAVYFPWRKWSVGVLLVVAVSSAVLINLRALSGRAEAASLQGEIYYSTGELKKAEQLLLFAEKEIDDPARFDNMLGSIARRKGDLTEAEKRFSRVIMLEPGFGDGWINLGYLYFRRPGMRPQAVHLIKEGLKRDPKMANGHNLLALDAVERRDFTTAEKYFALAVKFAPGNDVYVRNLANCRRLLAEQKIKGVQ